MKKEKIFRKDAVDKISSPEQLTEYLRISTPGIWLFMIAILLIIFGLICWAAAGTIETVTEAKAVVEDGRAQVIVTGQVNGEITEGMSVRIQQQESVVSDIEEDEYGRSVLYVQTKLEDGTYDAQVVTEQIHPIEFLLESR